MIDLERLKKVKLNNVAKKIEDFRETKQKMDIAYKHYRYVTPAKIDAFNEALKKETLKEDKRAWHYKRLTFTDIEQYDAIPPEPTLQKIEEAIAREWFDNFEICKIEWIKEIKDPIVFGVINGCPDKFFISQWDDDIKIDDIFLLDVAKHVKE